MRSCTPMSSHLLMIEDDERLAQMVAQYLQQSGYEVVHAPDGLSGLARLQDAREAQPPDMVLLDLMLPDIDGLEVCRRIRALPAPRATAGVCAASRTRAAVPASPSGCPPRHRPKSKAEQAACAPGFDAGVRAKTRRSPS